MASRLCVCGHQEEEHLLITTKGCTLCDCSLFREQTPFTIRTLLTEDGVSRVTVAWGSSTLQLTGDAAVQIGLELISAGYAARGEVALYTLAKAHDLDIAELLKIERQDT